MRPPPLKSKFASGPSEHELKTQRHLERNEKARLRMARKRAELKTRSAEEQALAAERSREYQATYREKNRADLKLWERERRYQVYERRYGREACLQYQKLLRDRIRRARQKKKAKEAYHPADAIEDGEAGSAGAMATR